MTWSCWPRQKVTCRVHWTDLMLSAVAPGWKSVLKRLKHWCSQEGMFGATSIFGVQYLGRGGGSSISSLVMGQWILCNDRKNEITNMVVAQGNCQMNESFCPSLVCTAPFLWSCSKTALGKAYDMGLNGSAREPETKGGRVRVGLITFVNSLSLT